MTKVDIIAYIDDLQAELRAERIADAAEISAILTGFLRDEEEPASRRIQAAAVLLKAAGSFARSSPPAPPGEEPEAGEEPGEGPGVVIRLPWSPMPPYLQPTHLETESGEIIPLQPPGEGMELVISISEIKRLANDKNG